MQTIHVYLLTTARSPKTQTARYVYILELQTPKGPATLTGKGEVTGTKHQIELRALLTALHRVTKPVSIVLHTDSRYLSSALNGWAEAWKENEWKTAKGKPAANAAEWAETLVLLCDKEIEIQVGQEHPYKNWMRQEIERKG